MRPGPAGRRTLWQILRASLVIAMVKGGLVYDGRRAERAMRCYGSGPRRGIEAALVCAGSFQEFGPARLKE